MIITQTPYRVSFAGGGTDLPAFYEQEYGAVLSMGVAHHMYVTVSPRFDKTTRVAYTRVEIADGIDKIEHTIAREALRLAVALEEFGELRADGRQAEVRLRARLARRDGSLVFQRRFAARVPVADGDPRGLASALGETLAVQLAEVTSAVVEAAAAEFPAP